MKKRVLLIIMGIMLLTLGACSKGKEDTDQATQEAEAITESSAKAVVNEEPDISQIRSICKLATLECYYHNVAKSEKEAGSGLTHWGESDRKFWTEYTGVAKIGVDMSKGDMKINGTEITIYMPEAEILSIKPDSESVSTPVVDTDGWNSNPIDADDVTGAVSVAQDDICESIQNDSSLLANAQDRAKKLIENYINQLGEASGTEFTVKWESVSNTSSGN